MTEPLIFEPPHTEEQVAVMRMLRAIGYRIEWEDLEDRDGWASKAADENPNTFFDSSHYRAVRPE